jgi:hypothetical protein
MCRMRRLTAYLLLFLALGSSLPGIAFLLFSFAIGLDVRITEPPLVFIGVAMTVLMFWRAHRLLSPQPQRRSVTD